MSEPTTLDELWDEMWVAIRSPFPNGDRIRDSRRAIEAEVWVMARAEAESELDPAREVMGLTKDAPAWVVLDRQSRQAYGYALSAIDAVALADSPDMDQDCFASWEDGFLQGHRAAREAVERLVPTPREAVENEHRRSGVTVQRPTASPEAGT